MTLLNDLQIDQLIEYVGSHPGCSFRDIRDALCAKHERVTATLRAMVDEDALTCERVPVHNGPANRHAYTLKGI